MVAKRKRKKREKIEDELCNLPKFCVAFLLLAEKEDSLIEGWIREHGIGEVAEYMQDDILAHYSNKAKHIFRVTDLDLVKVVNRLRDVCLGKIMGQMVEEGLVTEDVNENGEIVYRRTDKFPKNP